MPLKFIFNTNKTSRIQSWCAITISQDYEEEIVCCILSGKIKNNNDFCNYIYANRMYTYPNIEYYRFEGFKEENMFSVGIIDANTSNELWNNSIFLSKIKTY